MGETEVTQAQFEYVMGTNPAYFRCGYSSNTNVNSYANKVNATSALPVETVNWYDAITYCNKLSLKENKMPCYSVKYANGEEVHWEDIAYDAIPTSSSPSDTLTRWNNAYCDFSKNGYRLPTDSEWEYAARGGTQTHNYLYAGSSDVCAVAWYSGNNNTSTTCTNPGSGIYGTKPVKQKLKNELDLYDMSGNVYEWTWSGNNDAFPADTPSNAVQASGSLRVSRGGTWNDYESNCRVSFRYDDFPYDRYNIIGFRVAASIVP
jgi:formylglycine-generating enzyme required for sulfatase activity